jgi:Flp pilus assembly protein TadD
MKSFLLIPFLTTALAFANPPTSTALDAAKTALQKGDLAAADALLTPLTTAENPDAAACHQLGLIRQRQGRVVDAVALLEKAVALDPSKPDYHSALAMAMGERMRDLPFSEMGALSNKLRKAFAKSVELDPNHLAGLIGLARFYSNAPEIAGGSLERATEFAARVQKLNPFLGALELGNVAERNEDLAAALTHYEAAAKLKPDHAGAQVSAGRMLAKLGRKEDARVRFETALQLDPKRESVKKALAELGAP